MDKALLTGEAITYIKMPKGYSLKAYGMIRLMVDMNVAPWYYYRQQIATQEIERLKRKGEHPDEK